MTHQPCCCRPDPCAAAKIKRARDDMGFAAWQKKMIRKANRVAVDPVRRRRGRA